MKVNQLPPIFLGITQRAARRGNQWDFLGLTSIVMFPFFPQHLSGLQCLVAIPKSCFQPEKGELSCQLIFTSFSDQKETATQSFTMKANHNHEQISRNSDQLSVMPFLKENGEPSQINMNTWVGKLLGGCTLDLLPIPSCSGAHS